MRTTSLEEVGRRLKEKSICFKTPRQGIMVLYDSQIICFKKQNIVPSLGFLKLVGSELLEDVVKVPRIW